MKLQHDYNIPMQKPQAPFYRLPVKNALLIGLPCQSQKSPYAEMQRITPNGTKEELICIAWVATVLWKGKPTFNRC
jgi:hypothetical protein